MRPGGRLPLSLYRWCGGSGESAFPRPRKSTRPYVIRPGRIVGLADPELQRRTADSGHVNLVSLPEKSVYGYNAAGSPRVRCDAELTTNAESSGRKRCLAPC